MKQIRVLYSPDITITPTVLKAELRSIQLGSKDCGLFAIAYAVEIAYGNDPAKFIFKQSDMRQHLHNCLTSKSMSAFPEVRELHMDSVFKDITSDYQSEKWESPSKPIKHPIKKSQPDFITQNRFTSLASGIPTSQPLAPNPLIPVNLKYKLLNIFPVLQNHSYPTCQIVQFPRLRKQFWTLD